MKKNLVIEDGVLKAEAFAEGMTPTYAVPVTNMESGSPEIVFDADGDVLVEITTLEGV